MTTKHILPNLNRYRVVLASASPRRRELLAGLGIRFESLSLDVSEDYPKELPVEEIPCFLAEKKATAYDISQDCLLITADTIVCFEGRVYGKPQNRSEAERMLTELAGKTHLVITGLCIKTAQKQKTFSVTTKVRFATLDREEINFYLDNFEPYDKAGSYGIQEWIGYIAVESIEGSYFNVMGLPLQRLYSELKAF